MEYLLKVPIRPLTWPKLCACCGAAVPVTKKTRAGKTPVTWWEAPYCAACAKHHQDSDSLSGCIYWGSVGAAFSGVSQVFGASFAGTNPLNEACTLALIALASYGVFSAQQMRQQLSGCSAAGPAVQYEGQDAGCHRFRFTSKRYVDAFVAANSQHPKIAVTVEAG